jgi:sugar phosphate isomerase/epimerase
MDRRQLLQMSTATLATAALSRSVLAQAVKAAAASDPAPKSFGQFPLDVYSRDLQWLRSPAEVAKAVHDIGLQSVDLTVMPYPGHVDPTKVKTELPQFVAGLKKDGVAVTAITTPITDVDSPDAEAIIATAASAGIHYYSWGGFKYDESQPYKAQLDALKPRIAKIAKLNEKHGIKALYQPRIGADQVGSTFFDLLSVLSAFDPRFVAFRYDTAALLQATPQTTVAQLRLGAAYIGGVALNDAVIKLELPVWQDGPFAGTPQQLVGASSGGDNVGTDGGNPLAIGGGGRPLPYHFPAGTGMVDLSLVGKTLKEINFSGPAECQTEWALGGAELGRDKVTLARQSIIGGIKHNRLMIEAAFAASWNLDIARPAFLDPHAPKTSGRPGLSPAGPGPMPI